MWVISEEQRRVEVAGGSFGGESKVVSHLESYFYVVEHYSIERRLNNPLRLRH